MFVTYDHWNGYPMYFFLCVRSRIRHHGCIMQIEGSRISQNMTYTFMSTNACCKRRVLTLTTDCSQAQVAYFLQTIQILTWFHLPIYMTVILKICVFDASSQIAVNTNLSLVFLCFFKNIDSHHNKTT